MFRAWDNCGKYLAGSDGLIYSTNYNNSGKTKPLKGYFDKDGYPHVLMNIDRKRVYRASHKLIALAFHGEKPTHKHQVNHINGKRSDNRPENLEYLTSRENTIDGWKRGRKHSDTHNKAMSLRSKGENNPKAKLKEAEVLSIRRLRSKGLSLKEIAERHNISRSQVSSIANNRTWK